MQYIQYEKLEWARSSARRERFASDELVGGSNPSESVRRKKMFKSRITTLVMLVGVMCFTMLSAVSEYTQGRGYVWIIPTVLSITGLICILYIGLKKKKRNNNMVA